MISLALIPARSGSKGVPKKNIRSLGGYPLVAWAIRVASRSEAFQKVVVSSDSEEIIEIALKYGATDAILRPSQLALDSTKQFQVVKHAFEVFSDSIGISDSLMLLQPTSPFRRIQDIRSAKGRSELFPNKSLVSVVDATKEHESLFHVGLLDELNHSISGENAQGTLRQNFSPRWKRDGSIYVLGRSQIETGKLFSDKIVGYEMPRWTYCNIDDEEDFSFANLLMNDFRIREIRKELFE